VKSENEECFQFFVFSFQFSVCGQGLTSPKQPVIISASFENESVSSDREAGENPARSRHRESILDFGF
jgi:hypothetical protein